MAARERPVTQSDVATVLPLGPTLASSATTTPT